MGLKQLFKDYETSWIKGNIRDNNSPYKLWQDIIFIFPIMYFFGRSRKEFTVKYFLALCTIMIFGVLNRMDLTHYLDGISTFFKIDIVGFGLLAFVLVLQSITIQSTKWNSETINESINREVAIELEYDRLMKDISKEKFMFIDTSEKEKVRDSLLNQLVNLNSAISDRVLLHRIFSQILFLVMYYLSLNYFILINMSNSLVIPIYIFLIISITSQVIIIISNFALYLLNLFKKAVPDSKDRITILLAIFGTIISLIALFK